MEVFKIGVIAIKNKAVCIYSTEEERKNIFDRYNPKPHEFTFFGDTKSDLIKAKQWAETKKIVGMKIVSNMNNLTSLNKMKKDGISAVKIRLLNKEEFVLIMNSFYYLNTNIRLEYDTKEEKLKPIIYTGKRENAMKDLEGRIYNYGLKTSKFFNTAAVSYFTTFQSIFGFVPVKIFLEKRFSRYDDKILFSTTFEKFDFVEKEGLEIVNHLGNKQICDEDIDNIEEYIIPEKYSNENLINAIHFLERGGLL